MASTYNETESMTLWENMTVPAYYDSEYRIIAVMLFSVIFVVGFVGNMLVVVVVAKTRSMHTTTNCYLLSLAVADCLVLLSGTLPAIPEYFFRLDEWVYGAVLCHLLVFVQYCGSASSALSITAFTIERYIAVCHPIKAQTICTVHRAKRIIIVLWIFTISYSSPWIALTTVRERHYNDGTSDERCGFKLNRNDYLTYYMLDLVVFYVIPIVLTVTLYGLICRVLLYSANLSETSESTSMKLGKSNIKSNTSYSRNQVIRMLCVVVVIFIILWMPYRVLVVYNSFASEDFLDLWYILFCRTLVHINSAINPILYNAMSVKFRRAFRKLLFCGKRPPFEQRRSMYAENSDASKSRVDSRIPGSTRSRNGGRREFLA